MTEPTDSHAPPRLLLVDATRPSAAWSLWGMSLTERLLRQVSSCGLDRVVVRVSEQTAAGVGHWRPDLQRLHPLQCDLHPEDEPLSALDVDAGGLLIADGDVVHDDRLWQYLLRQGPDHAVTSADATLLWLSPEQWRHRHGTLAEGGDDVMTRVIDGLPVTTVEQLNDYVPELRLTMSSFMIRLRDQAQLRSVDHLLYRRTFKGVIDAIARYGYYHLVRLITRWLSRTTLSPNLFTVLSILGIWLAIPCFATGHLVLGSVSAWIGVLLDSVDGKLARLTLNLSDAMGTIEHLSAMPGLGLWFIALGWHLTGGDLLTPTTAMIACWSTVAAFLIDKVVSGSFRRHFGRELFDARPIDALFHLVAVRRNMHLLILTIGIAAQAANAAFTAMAAGMILTLAVHVARFAWISLTGGVAGSAKDV